MTKQHFVHAGEKGDAAAKQAHRPQGQGLRRPRGFQTCQQAQARHHLLNWEEQGRHHEFQGLLSVKGHVPYVSTSKKTALTLLVTYTICFCFWKWEKQLVTKKVPIMAGWERHYGYRGGKRWGEC